MSYWRVCTHLFAVFLCFLIGTSRIDSSVPTTHISLHKCTLVLLKHIYLFSIDQKSHGVLGFWGFGVLRAVARSTVVSTSGFTAMAVVHDRRDA